MFLFSYFTQAVVKDETPDQWDGDDDEEEQQQQQQQEDKEELRKKDKDLEFLFQEVRRDSSLDERLQRDLQSKKSDSKYKEMLVSIMISFLYTAIKVKPIACIDLTMNYFELKDFTMCLYSVNCARLLLRF